jgi:hypothetical protein
MNQISKKVKHKESKKPAESIIEPMIPDDFHCPGNFFRLSKRVRYSKRGQGSISEVSE